MIRTLTLAALLIVCGYKVYAQTISVRSGEHAEFTRLVLDLPNGLAWRLEQSENRVWLYYDSENVSFDFQGVFKRIPRDRLDKLVQTETGSPLELYLNCNCPISTFVERNAYLVIDIKNAEGEEEVKKEWSTAEPEVAVTSPILEFPFLGLTSPSEYGGEKDTSDGTARNEQGASLVSNGEVGFLGAPQTRQDSTILAETEKKLRQQIARAATQGLIDVEAESEDSASSDNIITGNLRGGDNFSNVRSTTSVDRDMLLVPAPLSLPGESRFCADPSLIDISSWGDDRPFGHQIGDHRKELAGEFDELGRKDLIRLAKTYLYFGFGAEAQQILRNVRLEEHQTDILVSLAKLLEAGELTEPHVFSNQLHCNSVVALWSAYSNPFSGNADVNTAAVLRAFVELPKQIRSHIGPNLLRRFVNAGDNETAELLRRLILRASPQLNTKMQMAEADLARLNGANDEADNLVRDVALGGSSESPEALLVLVQRHFELRKPLQSETVDLLSSYSQEWKHSSFGPDLAKSHALAIALSGDYHFALAALSSLTDGDVAKVHEKILMLVVEHSDDITFLELVMGEFNSSLVKFDYKLISEVVKRCIDLGFPDLAVNILDQPTAYPVPEVKALLLAKAALAAGRPRRSLLELVGRTDPVANSLRAEALEMAGLHGEAADAFLDINQMESAARAEWLAGVSSGLNMAQSAYGERLVASDRLANVPSEPFDSTLSSARALLLEAEAVRNDIEILNVGSNVEATN